MDCPLVAAVNGAAVAGGFELMCLSDLRIASADALIAAGDASLGLPTTSGLSWLLPRLVGVGRARYILYRDARHDRRRGARDRARRGRASAGELVERALDVAAEIAAMPGDGIRLTRQTVNDALTQTHAEAIEAELVAQREAYANPAVPEAIAAFFRASVRRRPPDASRAAARGCRAGGARAGAGWQRRARAAAVVALKHQPPAVRSDHAALRSRAPRRSRAARRRGIRTSGRWCRTGAPPCRRGSRRARPGRAGRTTRSGDRRDTGRYRSRAGRRRTP